MPNVKIELNTKNIGALLKSNEVKTYLESITTDIANKCGSGYATDTKVMNTRVIASVYTTNKEAYQDNLDNNTLLKASKS